MGTIELKVSIHKIVDGIQNEQLLRTLYDFLKGRQHGKTGELWDGLSQEQKSEVLLAFDESDDDTNLIDSKQIFKETK